MQLAKEEIVKVIVIQTQKLFQILRQSFLDQQEKNSTL